MDQNRPHRGHFRGQPRGNYFQGGPSRGRGGKNQGRGGMNQETGSMNQGRGGMNQGRGGMNQGRGGMNQDRGGSRFGTRGRGHSYSHGNMSRAPSHENLHQNFQTPPAYSEVDPRLLNDFNGSFNHSQNFRNSIPQHSQMNEGQYNQNTSDFGQPPVQISVVVNPQTSGARPKQYERNINNYGTAQDYQQPQVYSRYDKESAFQNHNIPNLGIQNSNIYPPPYENYNLGRPGGVSHDYGNLNSNIGRRSTQHPYYGDMTVRSEYPRDLMKRGGVQENRALFTKKSPYNQNSDGLLEIPIPLIQNQNFHGEKYTENVNYKKAPKKTYDLAGKEMDEKQAFRKRSDSISSQSSTSTNPEYTGRGRGRQRGQWRGKGKGFQKNRFGSVPDVRTNTISSMPVKKKKQFNKESTQNEPVEKFNEEIKDFKVAYKVKLGFKSKDSLKKSVQDKLKQEDKTQVKLKNNSLQCTETEGLFLVTIKTESKKLANKATKRIRDNISNSLECFVSYEFLKDNENATSEKSKQIQNLITNVRKTTQEDEQPTSPILLQTIKKDKIETNKAEKSVHDTTPKQTLIYLSIDKPFKSNSEAERFVYGLQKTLNLADYKVLPETVDIYESKTVCKIQVVSKLEASRVKSAIIKHSFSDCKVFVNILGQQDPNKKEETQVNTSSVKRASGQIAQAFETSIKNHEKIIDIYEKELNNLENDDEIDEKARIEILALTEKLEESINQKEEFKTRHMAIVSYLQKNQLSDKEINSKLKEFFIECKRLNAGLPIYARRKDILRQVKNNQVSIILGETGSGKSTQMVQYLYEDGFAEKGQIVCTQPRKVAAVTLASRVAKEMAVSVGNLVGYKKGCSNYTKPETKIVFCTDHALLNECLVDKNLSKYSCIVIDEAHERSIYSDILLGMIRMCLKNRPDLKVIVTSATIDPTVFINYFKCNNEMRVSGRNFPVEVFYESGVLQDFEDYEKKAVSKVVEIHESDEIGDILVFLPSAIEIMRCCEAINNRFKDKTNFKCFPLHGQLPAEEQQKVFLPLDTGIRKIVFSTNCAETSVTIDGIQFVIDTGVAKEMRFDPKKSMSVLEIQVISKSSADQRKGRAGRTSSGKCYRLYSEQSFSQMENATDPEILRVHLGQAVLKLAELGVDLETFDFVQPPSADALDSAILVLREIGALSSLGITSIGRWISKLPFDPRQGALVYHGNKENLLYDSLVLASLISNGANLFYKGLSESEEQTSAMTKINYGSELGDVFSWFAVYKKFTRLARNDQSKYCKENNINYKVLNFARQTVNEIVQVLLKEFAVEVNETFSLQENAIKVLQKLVFKTNLASLSHFLGHKKAGYSVLSLKRQVHIHPSSTFLSLNIQPEWIVYTEIMKTSREFIKCVTTVEEEWIQEAIKDGILQVNIHDAKQESFKIVYSEELGKSAFRSIVGPRFSKLKTLEEELIFLSNNSAVVIEADPKLGTISIYSNAGMNENVLKLWRSQVLEAVSKIKTECYEKQLSENTNSVRVIVGAGGSIKTILMSEESNKVLIEKAPADITEGEIREYFSKFGNVIQCIPFTKGNSWGLVKFSDALSAANSIEQTKQDAFCDAKLKKENDFYKNKNKFEAKLSWCRRPLKGTGTTFIKCPPIERVNLLGKSIEINGRIFEIELAKNENDLILNFVKEANEIEIKQKVLQLLEIDDTNEIAKEVRVNRVRTPQFETSNQDLNCFKQAIVDQVERFISKDKFEVDLIKPKKQSIQQIGILRFNSPIEGFEVCKRLQSHLRVNEANVEISLALRTTLNVPNRVMKACSKRFDEIVTGFKTFKDVEIVKRETKTGFCYIDIKTSDPGRMVEARELIKKEMEGETIDCENALKKCLLKTSFIRYVEKQLIKEGLKKSDFFLIADNIKDKLSFYGSVTTITQINIQINKYLEQMNKDSCVFDLRDWSVPSLLKNIALNYGDNFEKLQSECELNNLIIDWKSQKLHVFGSDTAISTARKKLEELADSLSQAKKKSQTEKPECCLCYTEIEDLDNLYRLESCGHAYCKDCLKHQMKTNVEGKFFPFLCVKDECREPISLKDIKFAIEKKWIQEKKLVDMSVGSFVSKNSKFYKYCPTPNCSSIYRVTDNPEGSEYNCPNCFSSVCTSCHAAFHSGLSCRMSQTEQQFTDWLTEDPSRGKRCPGCSTPIVKSEGCNKMVCLACEATFCWLCLEKFDGIDAHAKEQACYAHLVKKHSSIF